MLKFENNIGGYGGWGGSTGGSEAAFGRKGLLDIS